jgi:hypothetical protein
LIEEVSRRRKADSDGEAFGVLVPAHEPWRTSFTACAKSGTRLACRPRLHSDRFAMAASLPQGTRTCPMQRGAKTDATLEIHRKGTMDQRRLALTKLLWSE